MFAQRKPYSAVTVTIENLTSESHSEDDLSGIPDLVEVIKLQTSGPSEAARAIRKKLKYGNVHRQLRALVLLDGLMQNAGPRFQRTFADEPLLERLRVCGTSNLSDPAVRRKCSELFRDWAQYSSTPGLERIARLYREIPKKKVPVTQERSKVIRETENPFGDDEEEEAEQVAAAGPSQDSSSRTSSSHPRFMLSYSDKKKDKERGKDKSKAKNRRRPFDLEAEKDKMKSVIAESSIESTSLMNSLQSINRERERISENVEAVLHFEACKQLRRRILRYIHHVESEQWLGSLLHANDELVHALMAFEQLDQSIDADSDSDDALAEQAHMYRMATLKGQPEPAHAPKGSPHLPDFSGPSLKPKPPAARPETTRSNDYYDDDDDDEDGENPFGDKNVVVDTPGQEGIEPRW